MLQTLFLTKAELAAVGFIIASMHSAGAIFFANYVQTIHELDAKKQLLISHSL